MQLSPQHPILLGALLPGEQKMQAVWPFALGQQWYRTTVRGPGLRVPAP